MKYQNLWLWIAVRTSWCSKRKILLLSSLIKIVWLKERGMNFVEDEEKALLIDDEGFSIVE